MLSESILSQNAQNRRAEKPLISLALLQTKLPGGTYQSIIEWVFSVHYLPDGVPSIFSYLRITQTASYLRLMPTTSCLARLYFDLALQANQETDADRCVEMMIACLALAIKFNQMRTVSEKVTAESLFALCSLDFSRDNYFNIEVKIFYALGLRFRYTTPLDYVDILMARFPFFPSMQKILPGFIELACIHPNACEFSSEQLFFGAVLAIFELKGMVLGELQTKVLLGLTDGWERSKVVKMRMVDDIKAYGV